MPLSKERYKVQVYGLMCCWLYITLVFTYLSGLEHGFKFIYQEGNGNQFKFTHSMQMNSAKRTNAQLD
jgi:hypothetical protein